MEKIKELFNPIYREVEQVKRCANLGERVVDARIALVIGHNGKNFISSTDWRLVTESGAERIFPFFIHAQYPTFVECISGYHYFTMRGLFFVQPIATVLAKPAVVVVGDKKQYFRIGEALKIYVEPNSKFIATDCVVTCEENDEYFIYTVVPDDNTQYGYLDENGCASKA